MVGPAGEVLAEKSRFTAVEGVKTFKTLENRLVDDVKPYFCPQQLPF